jgi:hypothetical protein
VLVQYSQWIDDTYVEAMLNMLDMYPC